MNSRMPKLSSDTKLSMLWAKCDFHVQVDIFMELPNKLLDLVMQKEYMSVIIFSYPYEYMSSFGKFKEKLSNKESFIVFWPKKKISDKEYEHVLKAWNKFEKKTMKAYHNLYLKVVSATFLLVWF